MVIDRITDGTRIAQLLSSELDGREDGGLEAVSVVNADRDVEPTETGARAYDVVVSADVDQEEREHERDAADEDTAHLAKVFVHPDRARLVLDADRGIVEAAAADVALEVEVEVEGEDGDATESDSDGAGSAGGTTASVIVDSGAAVKRATDVVQRLLEED